MGKNWCVVVASRRMQRKKAAIAQEVENLWVMREVKGALISEKRRKDIFKNNYNIRKRGV